MTEEDLMEFWDLVHDYHRDIIPPGEVEDFVSHQLAVAFAEGFELAQRMAGGYDPEDMN